jgi:hypothetical protein
MRNAALIAEFADDGNSGNGRYANIYGYGMDAFAWWGPANDYIIPMWYLGDIPAGESATKRVRFYTYTNIPYGSDLNMLLRDSLANNTDIFLNRDTSVGISNYADDLAADLGGAFPVPPQLSSNVSVVFVPEPAAMSVLGFLVVPGLALLRRKRR